MNIVEELKWRGAIYDVSDETLFEKLLNDKVKMYIGADATASSLHIGNLASLITAKMIEKAGHEVFFLIGGATTLVGDPKITDERELRSVEDITHSREMIIKEVTKIFDFQVVNNLDWMKNFSFLDFLRDVGKFYNVSYMINKDLVKKRLESGISYTEFSYQLIQGYDFYHLYKEKGICLQAAGQDQWGNITSGLELIRKKIGHNAHAYGMTFPLITKADGTKYGKTESGTIWLNPEFTKPYDFYQFFINIVDDEVLQFLKRFTFLKREEIESIYEEFLAKPHERLAQKTLAYEVTKLVHGKEVAARCVSMSEAFFKSDITLLQETELLELYYDVLKKTEHTNLLKNLVEHGIAKSNREAREFISGNAISINNKKVTDVDYEILEDDLYLDKYFLLKRGKKKYYLFEVK